MHNINQLFRISPLASVPSIATTIFPIVEILKIISIGSLTVSLSERYRFPRLFYVRACDEELLTAGLLGASNDIIQIVLVFLLFMILTSKNGVCEVDADLDKHAVRTCL